MITNTSILLYILTILVVILAVLLIRMELRLKKFMVGSDAKSLEGIFNSLVKDLRNLEKAKQQTDSNINEIESKLKKSIRGLQTARFNAFKDSGGNQSFAIALLNEEGDGVILSSLYSRERMSVFAKPIKKLSSEYELTGEEREVLNKAKL